MEEPRFRDFLSAGSGRIRSEMRRVNPVEIIDRHAGKIPARAPKKRRGRPAERQPGPREFRVIPRRSLPHFRQRRQGNGLGEILRDFEIIVEVRENQHRQIEPRVEIAELCFLKLAFGDPALAVLL